MNTNKRITKSKGSTKPEQIVRGIRIMDRDKREFLMYPFISLREMFTCELGIRSVPSLNVKTSRDKALTYSRFTAGKLLLNSDHIRTGRFDKTYTTCHDMIHPTETPIFTLRHLQFNNDHELVGQVVWQPGYDPIGKKLLMEEEPSFCFAPIVALTTGDTQYGAWIVGFDILRK